MSAKYGRLTISASGSYNWYLYGPGEGGRFNVGTRGLAPPPFPGAASAWVNPTNYVRRGAWQVGSISEAVRIKLGQIRKSAWLTVVTLEKFTVLAVPILMTSLVVAARSRQAEDVRNASLAATAVLFLSGYVLIMDRTLERLIWITIIVLIVLCCALLNRAELHNSLRLRSALAIVLIVGSFWPLPLRRIAQEIDEGRNLHELAVELQSVHGLHGRVATLNRYADSLRVAYLARTPFYGRVSQRATVDEVLADLRAHDIDHFLIWREGESPAKGRIAAELLRRFPHRTVRNGELRVLDVKPARRRNGSAMSLPPVPPGRELSLR
jgi:hypothetical protein